MYKTSYKVGNRGPMLPCYDCKDNCLLCHLDCSKYAEYRDKVNAYNNPRNKIKAVITQFASKHKIGR